VNGEVVSAGLDPDDDMPGARLKVIRLFIGDAIFFFDQGCEDVAISGIDGLRVKRIQHIDGWVCGIPRRNYNDPRPESARSTSKSWAERAIISTVNY
jgi:predicted RNA-binding protein with PUA-like domain